MVGADGDDGILHAVEQGFQLTLAGLQGREAFLQMAGSLIERTGHLANFISGFFVDARRQVAVGDAVGELHNLAQASRCQLRCDCRYEESDDKG